MNVLIVGKFSADQFGFHISDTLKEMKHNTIEFDPTLEYKYTKTTLGRRIHQLNHFVYNTLINSEYFRNKRKIRLKKILSRTKIDLTISTHDFLYPDEVDLIKDISKSPIVLWFPDGIGTASKALFMISNYTRIFFQDPYAAQILTNQYNKKTYYLPEAFNPKFHYKVTLSEEDISKYSCDITTYGNPHNYRAYFFSLLNDLNISIKIWGHQPPAWNKNLNSRQIFKGEYLTNEEKSKAVLASKINLNTLVPAGVLGLNGRTFEIAGIGGFQMIHWRAGLRDLFEDGKEIVSFNSFNDLKEKIDFYLREEKERKSIAQHGYIRAQNDHNFENRLKIIFDTVFNEGSGFPVSSNKFELKF